MRSAFSCRAALLLASLSIACGDGGAGRPFEPSTPTGAGTLKTLQVAPFRVECVGVGPQMCLQVRESSDAAWTALHDEIDGFDYEAGYAYAILVTEERVANPPADASSIQRTLVTILGKTPVPLSLVGPVWRLVSVEGRATVAGTRITAAFEGDDRVSGSAGCNRYFGRAAAVGGRLDVGPLASTRIFCADDGVMEQEQAYLAALERSRSYRIEGGTLHVGPSPSRVTLVYEAE